MNVFTSFIIVFFISEVASKTIFEPNPTKKECNLIIDNSVLCTKLKSLSELSELMQPNWVDVIILNRPSFPFAVDGKLLDGFRN